jgi:type II secretory ATPase GspE/PulE/Tfp pilus assembly ATPase PilB-like protein
MRRLCETCKVPYQPTEAALKKLNLPANKVKQLYKAGGKIIVKGNNMEECPDCQGSGYDGQTGVFEVLQFGDEEREIIQAGDLQRLRAELRKKKTMFIPDAALAKVIEGTTSIEEVNRVMRPTSGSSSSSSSKTPART